MKNDAASKTETPEALDLLARLPRLEHEPDHCRCCGEHVNEHTEAELRGCLGELQ